MLRASFPSRGGPIASTDPSFFFPFFLLSPPNFHLSLINQPRTRRPPFSPCNRDASGETRFRSHRRGQNSMGGYTCNRSVRWMRKILSYKRFIHESSRGRRRRRGRRKGKKGSRSREEKRNGYRLKASPVSFLLFFPASLTDARLILDSREFDTNKTTSPRSSIRRGGRKDPKERGRDEFIS